MAKKRLRLWSLRESVSRGEHWYPERDVTTETQEAWLKQYQADEPSVLFRVSKTIPYVPAR